MFSINQNDLRGIAETHGLEPSDNFALLGIGQVSAVHTLNNQVVIRVALDDTLPTEIYEQEAKIIGLARALSIRTPAVLGSGTVLGRPYVLLERVWGQNLGSLTLEPRDVPEVYRALGRDLARWHLRPAADSDLLSDLPRDSHADPRPGLAHLIERGFLPLEGTRWLERWLDRLAPHAASPQCLRVVHGDARPSNVLVSGDLAYQALLDWGDAQWADPASEFALMPLRAVPFALEGYRELRPDAGDEVNEARILWYHLSWAMYALERPTSLERTWSAPPAGRLLELLHFFVDGPSSEWLKWVP